MVTLPPFAACRRWFAVRSQPSKKQNHLHGVSAPRDAVRARVYGVRADDAESSAGVQPAGTPPHLNGAATVISHREVTCCAIA
jgi:hypothetical protein